MIAPELNDLISRLAGAEATDFRKVSGGYSPAARWLFRAGKQTFFAKIGTNSWTNKQLVQEINAYARISGHFMPRCIAADDNPEYPILILEDLSHYSWPPPWTTERIERVLHTLDEIHGSTADLAAYSEVAGLPAPGWPDLATDPEPFLSLGLVTRQWLDAALPILIEAEAKCNRTGNALTHWDIRSDNICLSGGVVKLIDWNGACLGNAKLDLGFWLPSLAHEGGPAPEEIIGDEPEIAALVAAYFAARAGLHDIPNAPHVRDVQRQQLVPALAWAIRALGLPAADGPQQ